MKWRARRADLPVSYGVHEVRSIRDTTASARAMPPEVIHRHQMTVEEYLELDASAQDTRYEYLAGRVFALAGASPTHTLIKDNIRSELHPHLRPRECRSFTSDQRVQLGAGDYVYPDLVALCGPPRYTDDDPASLLNPKMIVEVSSESTRDRDHSSKLDAYLDIESLQEYWMVEAREPLVVQYVRRGEEWVVRTTRDLDAMLKCEAFGLEISLSDVYALVDFADEAENAPTASGTESTLDG